MEPKDWFLLIGGVILIIINGIRRILEKKKDN